MKQALYTTRQELHPAILVVVALGLALQVIAFVAIGATALVDFWHPLVQSGVFIIEESVLGAGGSLFLGAGFFAGGTLLRQPVLLANSDTPSQVMDLAA